MVGRVKGGGGGGGGGGHVETAQLMADAVSVCLASSSLLFLYIGKLRKEAMIAVA